MQYQNSESAETIQFGAKPNQVRNQIVQRAISFHHYLFKVKVIGFQRWSIKPTFQPHPLIINQLDQHRRQYILPNCPEWSLLLISSSTWSSSFFFHSSSLDFNGLKFLVWLKTIHFIKVKLHPPLTNLFSKLFLLKPHKHKANWWRITSLHCNIGTQDIPWSFPWIHQSSGPQSIWAQVW